jgi:hypothetical protein
MEQAKTQTLPNPEPSNKKNSESSKEFAEGIEGLLQALKGGGQIISATLPDGTVIYPRSRRK